MPIRHSTQGTAYPDAGNFSPSAIDLDRDRYPEVVGTANRGGSLHFVRPDRKGLATLFPPALADVPQRANRDARAADLNGDEWPDLIVDTYTSTDVPSPLRLFLGDAMGGFREIAVFARDAAGAPLPASQLRGRGETIVVADFNGDGRPDLYVPYYTFADYQQTSCAPGDSTCDPIPAACRNDPYCDPATVPVNCPEDDPFVCGPNARTSLLLINAGNGLLGAGPDEPMFVEMTAAAGSTYRANVGLERRYPGGTGELDPCGHQPEGAQAIDYDGDGHLDLYVAGHLFRNAGTRAISTSIGPIHVPQFQDVTEALGLFDQIDLNADVAIPVLRSECAATGACDTKTCTAITGAPAPNDVCAMRRGSVRDALVREGVLRADRSSLNCVRAGSPAAGVYRKFFLDAREFGNNAKTLRFRLFEEGAKFLDWNNDGCLDLALVKTWSSTPEPAVLVGAPTAYDPLDRADPRAPGDPPPEAVKSAGMRLFECQPDGFGRPRSFRERTLAGPFEPEADTDGAFFQIDRSQDQQLHFYYQPVYGFNVADLDNDGREDIVTARGHVFRNSGDRFVSIGANAWGWGNRYEYLFSPMLRGGLTFADVDRDGRVDFVYPTRSTIHAFDSAGNYLGYPTGDSMTWFENLTPQAPSVRHFLVDVRDAQGRRNQHGRLVRVKPPSGMTVHARVVDGGSGYLAQTEYLVNMATGETGPHEVSVFYGATPVTCTVAPGQELEVRPTGQVCRLRTVPTPAAIGTRARNTGRFVSATPYDGLLVENETDGTVVVWSSSGRAFLGDWGHIVVPGLRAAAVADFDGDGLADVLLEDVNDWSLHVRLNVGGGFSGAWGAQPHSGFRILAAADIDGDGRADLILENPALGQVVVWATVGSRGGERFSYLAAAILPVGFTLRAVADFDADGRADLLIESLTDNGLHVWTTVRRADGSFGFNGAWGAIPAAGVRLAATADVDGDGTADLILEDFITPRVTIWRSRRSGNAGWFEAMDAMTTPLDAEAHVAGAGDFDGDGRADLLIERRTDLSIQVWRIVPSSSTTLAFIADWASRSPPPPGYRLARF